jgi:hypothetical protein
MVVDAMQQDQDSDNESQEREQKDRVRDSLSRPEITGIAIAFWIFVTSFFLLRLYIYDHVPVDPERTKVLIESMFSLVLAIVVIVQAGIYFKQAKALDKQIKATKEGTIYAQRAYVYAKIGEVASDDTFDVVLLIENSGNSPANNVRISYKAQFKDTDPHKDCGDWDSFRDPRFRPRPIGVLPPKIHFPETIYHRPVPTPEQLRKYYQRGWNFHCWGEILYDDVFGNEWYTSFAFYVTAIGGQSVIMPGLTGNEAK